MTGYFTNPDDLGGWVRSKSSPDEAAGELMDLISVDSNSLEVNRDEQDVYDSCRAIFEQDEYSDAPEILFGVLAKHDITKLKKEASNMNKKASMPRARNNWTRNSRNKFNRVVDEYNEDTPWRIGRDKYYDFTHYMIDAISFDEDPHNIYSGESIWRTYVMDKFYRDYKDEEGKITGGYIRDRFHVIPDHGTPSNPDFPRHGGNSMELADGERTRKPRPHQYSTERRLEESRGNKMESITVSADSFDKIVKIASTNNFDQIRKNKIYNIFKDTIEMREAGIDYKKMIDSICDHYNASVLGVSQIDKVAQKMIHKHNGIAYKSNIKTAETMADVAKSMSHENITIVDINAVKAFSLNNNSEIFLEQGTKLVQTESDPSVYEIIDHPVNASLIGQRVTFPDMNFEVSLEEENIQDAADELGLNEETEQKNEMDQNYNDYVEDQNFEITEV